MGIIMLKDVQYGGVTQSEMETTLDDYQTKEDDGLETTSNEVVGAINELNMNKQNIIEDSLTTSIKNIPGAINQLNSYKIAAVNLPHITGNNYSTLMASLLNFFENSIGVQEVRLVRFTPSFYEQYFKGFAQLAICYKNSTGAYHTYLPTVGMSSYYYDGNWHWQQETRTNVTPS